MERYVLGVDVGTGGTRALVLNEAGQVVNSATQEHAPFTSPDTGWAEQHPDDWSRAAQLAIRKGLTLHSLAGRRIAFFAFSGQMHRAVMLGSAGNAERPS